MRETAANRWSGARGARRCPAAAGPPLGRPRAALEIQAEGDLARPLGQLRCMLGDRGVGGHGVRFSETPCSWPGASSIVWSWTRTWIGWALPGRELSRTWA